MVFPGNQVDRKMTINGPRGFHPRIKDRFDLTLECIRRHYLDEPSPLSDTLARYADFFGLFGDFAGYVDFFLLQDLVNEVTLTVRFFLPFEGFTASPLPGTLDAYFGTANARSSSLRRGTGGSPLTLARGASVGDRRDASRASTGRGCHASPLSDFATIGAVFHIHRAERADGLVAALGTVVSAPLDDPMEAEVVAVPTRGVERWLTQRLSAVLGASPGRGDGVCANVEFPFPGPARERRRCDGRRRRPRGRSVARRRGRSGRCSTWSRRRLASPGWRRWRRTSADREADADRPARAPVEHACGTSPISTTATPSIARRCCARGRTDDGDGWQAELWRRLRERIGEPSPAERLDDACARLRAEPDLVDLPRACLAVRADAPPGELPRRPARAGGRAGRASLPPAPVGRAVGADRVVHARPRADRAPRRGRDRGAAAESAARLLGSGRARDAARPRPATRTTWSSTTTSSSTSRRPTLLGRIQADVRADRAPPGPPLPGAGRRARAAGPDDRSLQVHACHGRARQVEVVRDAILHLLADDPTLEPRDIVVMCPDIEVFAPLIHATFGTEVQGDEEDGSLPTGGTRIDLRVRLADRSLRQTNPVLGVVAQLLELAGGRLTASQVLDLAGRAPVRRRFRLDDDDLARIAQWARDSGVRWGLDAAQRAPYQLERLAGEHVAGGLGSGAASAWRWRRRDSGCSGECFRSTTSAAATSISQAASPSSSSACTRIVDAFADPMPLDAWAAAIAEAADSLTAAPGPGGLAAHPARPPARGGRRRGHDRRRGHADGARAARDPRAAGRPAARPADAGELPHRPPHDLHARADAVGAAPGRLPDGARRRRLPAADGARRRRPASGSTRTSAIATRAARTASCCSTRCWPRPTTW